MTIELNDRGFVIDIRKTYSPLSIETSLSVIQNASPYSAVFRGNDWTNQITTKIRFNINLIYNDQLNNQLNCGDHNPREKRICLRLRSK